MDTSFISQALGVAPPLFHVFNKVCIDSRQVQPNDLFVAISGDIQDGHQFIVQAIENGATGVICEKPFTSNMPIAIFLVNNTKNALKILAQEWRKTFSIPVIAIAGSVGKSTTKELLATCLEVKYCCIKTEKSENGHLGIPLTILKIRTHHEIAIIEIGIDEIGAMQKHLEIVQPTAGIITDISEEHLTGLNSIEQVAQEELLLFEYLKKHQRLSVVNMDNLWLKNYYYHEPSPYLIPYSLTAEQKNGWYGRYLLQSLSVKNYTFYLPLAGRHNALNFLGVLVLAHAFHIPFEQIEAAFQNFQGLPGRSELIKRDDIVILNDSYNAQPKSVLAGIYMAQEIVDQYNLKRMWICLADMLELHDQTNYFHLEVAKEILNIQSSCLHGVLLFGDHTKIIAQYLKENFFQKIAIHFETHATLFDFLYQHLQPKDLIFIKGSRKMRMDKIVDDLLKHIA